MTEDTTTSLELARKVLRIEAAAILGLVERLNGTFEHAVQLLYDCRGRVIVTGMGKSGIICRKIAATLSSTGTSAFFLHPAEAIHGDLGASRSAASAQSLSCSQAIHHRPWPARPTSRWTAASRTKRVR
jgi:DNA-binding MurR/RpiR family transcriptional regulator